MKRLEERIYRDGEDIEIEEEKRKKKKSFNDLIMMIELIWKRRKLKENKGRKRGMRRCVIEI